MCMRQGQREERGLTVGKAIGAILNEAIMSANRVSGVDLRWVETGESSQVRPGELQGSSSEEE